MATTKPQSRTRPRSPATTVIELTANGHTASPSRRTPTDREASRVPTVTVLKDRAIDAALAELANVSVDDVVFVVSSLVIGQPVSATRAVEVLKVRAVTTALTICRHVINPSPPT